MAFTHTSTLTTNNANTYADVDAWIAEHGPCGTKNDTYVTSGTLVLNGNNAVDRTLVYPDSATADSHAAAYADDRAGYAYTVSNASTATS